MKKDFKSNKKILIVINSISIILMIFVLVLLFIGNNNYNKKIKKNITQAAKQYFLDNNYQSGEYREVNVNTLIENGYLESKENSKEDMDTIIIASGSIDNINLNYETATAATSISGYSTTIEEVSCTNTGNTFQTYLENNETIYKMQTSTVKTCSRFFIKIKGLNPDNYYLFKADIKAKNVSNEANSRGGQIITPYIVDNVLSYSFGYSNAGEINLKGTTDWIKGKVVVTPAYNYDTEDESQAEIEIYLGLGGMSQSDYSFGTLYFKNLELIDLEDEEQTQDLEESEKIKVFTSTNNKIKFSQPVDITNNMTEELVQYKVNKLEQIYESYSDLVGTTTNYNGKLYPFNARPLKFIQNNFIAYGGLANNPILINNNSAWTKLNRGNKDTIAVGYLHELSHTFDRSLSSIDNSYKLHNKYNFHAEELANIKIPYALYSTNTLTADGWADNTKTYKDLLNDYYNSSATDLSIIQIYYPILTSENNGEIDWDAFKKTYTWFNETQLPMSNASQRMFWYLKKLDDFSLVDIRKELTDDDINSMQNSYNTNLKPITNITEINNPIYLNSNNVKMFDIEPADAIDLIYISSDESIATIDELGNIKSTGKAGTVTFTATGYFNTSVKKEITKTINKWNVSNPDGESNVTAELSSDRKILTIEGTGKMQNWDSVDFVPWKNEKLTQVIINEGITKIGANALNGQDELINLSIPSSVSDVENNAFLNTTLNSMATFIGEKNAFVDAPSVLLSALESTNILYSNNIVYNNCSLENNKIKINLDDIRTNNASININSGLLNGLKINITKNVWPLYDIDIKVMPTKIKYVEGENFNESGLIVEAIYKEGTSEEVRKNITNYTIINSTELNKNQTSVILSFTDEGITKTKEIPITVVEKIKLETTKYEKVETEEGNYIKGILENTKITDFKTNLESNGPIKVYKELIEQIENDIVGTGNRINIKFDEQEKDYIAIVKGDVNGDGIIDTGDTLVLHRHAINKTTMANKAFIMAGKINNDNIIDPSDVLLVENYILKKVTTLEVSE